MKILKQIDRYLLFGLLFLFPIFFLPVFTNQFETAKLLLLLIAVTLLSLIKIFKYLSEGGFEFKTSKFDIYVILLTSIYILSTIFISPNKIDALLIHGTTSFIILGSIVYFFVNQLNENEKETSRNILTASAVTVSIIQITSSLGLITKDFNLFGNLLSSASFLILIIPISIYKALFDKNIYHKVIFGLSVIVMAAGLTLNIYAILPGKITSLNIPSLKTSWSIAIDSIKTNPLLGFGPSNYQEAYNKLRPLSANADKNWNIKYIVSTNSLFTILTEIGVIGLLVFIMLFTKSLTTSNKESAYYSLFAIAIFLILVPVPSVIFPLIFVMFSLNNSTHIGFGRFSSKLPLIFLTLPFIGIIITTVYFSYKGFVAEYTFSNAVKAVSANDALDVYNNLNKAIKINPYVDKYHLAAADINIIISSNLAKKENLSDEDKKTISELIQQAITEGKASVAVNQKKSSNWEALGDIYSKISGFAKDANGFAAESYNQAIFLEPINPITRIKLGGIYYAESKYTEAIKIFELAVLAKPDFANSHYNLAMAYKGNKEFDKAKEQIQIVLKLVDLSSNDYKIAKNELDSLDSVKTVEKVAEKTVEAEELTTPPVEPEPIIEPQVQIPQE